MKKLKPGDLVVVKVKEISENSALVEILDYNLEGIIHISEIATTWVKDIRKHLKENEITVCQVLLSRGGNYIDLSLKRVNESLRKEKLEEWKENKKAERFVEIISKEAGMSLKDVNKNIIERFKEKYGSAFAGFEMSLKDPEEIKNLIGEKYFEIVKKIAEKHIRLKTYEIKEIINLHFTDSKGIMHIKNAFDISGIDKDNTEVEISYVSSPKYNLMVRGKNIKKCKEIMNKIVEKISDYAEKNGGEFSIEN